MNENCGGYWGVIGRLGNVKIETKSLSKESLLLGVVQFVFVAQFSLFLLFSL